MASFLFIANRYGTLCYNLLDMAQLVSWTRGNADTADEVGFLELPLRFNHSRILPDVE